MLVDAPLFQRHNNNPILTAADWLYPAHTVFNPGAVRLRDGTTLLLCRVEDYRGISHLCAARSANGFDGWAIDAEPTLQPLQYYPDELWGIEDPRITFIEELDKYVIVYTAYSRKGSGVALALTEDFRTFTRHGLILQPSDKNAALLPQRIGGKFILLHRPTTDEGKHIWISSAPNLLYWGPRRRILQARNGWWDASIGIAFPPIKTPQGWLVVYHGAQQTTAGKIYRLGVALLALDQPERCIARGDSWIFGPKVTYERVGNVGNVVFSCGATIGDDGDTINLYYGAADTCIALATGSVRKVLSWLAART